VAAVDSSGWLSAPSDPAAVSTAPPVPSNGAAQAFLLASTSRSFADLRAHYRQIGVVYPTYYDCSSSGGIAGQDDPLVSHWTQQRAIKLLPRFNCQRETVVKQILTDPALRQRWIDGIVAAVEQNGYDGAQLDLEKGGPTERSAMTSFVTELASRLHADGKLLSVAVNAKTWDDPNHPRSTVFDYVALSQQADWIFVMAWGIHWGSSTPGAQDDLTWLTKVVAYLDTMPDRGRFVLGTQLYGDDWPNGGGQDHPATPYEYAGVQALIARVGATPVHDPTADSWTFSYQDASGTPHEVWYGDATTTHTRVRLAHDHGLGIGFWRLGNEDQRLWDDPLLQPPAGSP
jgi:spore germination protein YaaH